MSSLPPALDFAKAEEAICDKWAEEGTFKTQDKLGKERGDEVRPLFCIVVLEMWNIMDDARDGSMQEPAQRPESTGPCSSIYA